MEPIPYVELMKQRYESLGFPPYQWSVHEDAPLTPLRKPLSECAVTILTSGGVSKKAVPGFDPYARNDFRLDEIESDYPSDGFKIDDSYYDHTDAQRDINCIFAIDRLREMARAGEIGAVTPRFWSGFMGRTYMRAKLVDEVVPEFARRLKEDGTDVLVAVPACPLDQQTVALVCRVVEQAGIPTVCISTARDITQLVKPPRGLFVNAPMGNNFGRPGDVATQSTVLREALRLVVEAKNGGVLLDSSFEWPEPFFPEMSETTREAQLKK
ncbi:MAG TPA: glycine/sarcosine/betaine reductase selenoprotein B family protein [Quisquiliibacterium sp.]|nr:glycine/sarcosine/betaine reductase selenoprotein B family protein [Quisquiliibacterium sp.]